MALFGGGLTRTQQLEQELAQAKRTIAALSNTGHFDRRLISDSAPMTEDD